MSRSCDSGTIHNSSLAAKKYAKVSIDQSLWHHHIYNTRSHVASEDHCALWCRLMYDDSRNNIYCELFSHDAGSNTCYLGNLAITTGSGPAGLSNVYFDPSKNNH